VPVMAMRVFLAGRLPERRAASCVPASRERGTKAAKRQDHRFATG
jgi:hypothetical protein